MTSVGRCSARAALAGNPTDGYGGFVVAVPIPSLAATASISPASRFEIVHSPTADDTFDDLASLVEHVDRFGMDDARRLVLATIRALVRRTDASIDQVRIDVATTIPRSVGLAGSSAIVIATLRSLIAAHRDTTWASHLSDHPDQLAALALSVEADELGIGAGLQDRLVQSYDMPVAMDFSADEPHTIGLGAIPGRLVVAARVAGAEPSGALHHNLRADFDADVGSTRSILAAMADAGRSAAAAIDHSDVDALGAAMDRTLELRAGLLSLDPDLVAVADVVRAHGGHANWTGSGGAIVALLPDGVDDGPLRARLAADHACQIIDV